MSTKQIQKSNSDIYSYDKQIQGIFGKIERDLPKYHRVAQNVSASKKDKNYEKNLNEFFCDLK